MSRKAQTVVLDRRVRVELDDQGIKKLPYEEIWAILRARGQIDYKKVQQRIREVIGRLEG